MHGIERTEKPLTIKYIADYPVARFSYMPQIPRAIEARGIQRVINEIPNKMTNSIAWLDD